MSHHDGQGLDGAIDDHGVAGRPVAPWAVAGPTGSPAYVRTPEHHVLTGRKIRVLPAAAQATDRLSVAQTETADRGDDVRVGGRLEEVCATLNHGRRKPVGVSSVVRALLERGLNDPGDALDFDGKVMRPERAIRARAARLKAGEQERAVAKLHQAVERLVDRLEMTPLAFARAIGGDRFAAQRFLQAGVPPDGDTAPFLERVRAWVAENGE